MYLTVKKVQSIVRIENQPWRIDIDHVYAQSQFSYRRILSPQSGCQSKRPTLTSDGATPVVLASALTHELVVLDAHTSCSFSELTGHD